MTPSDTAISLLFALRTGPTAAMALPPQIAVPDEIRYAVLRLRCIHQPTIMPMTITPKTDATVNIMPSLPDFSDSVTLIPNPSPTTDTCNRYFEVFLLNVGYGQAKIMAYIRPKNSATAGVIYCFSPNLSNGNRHSIIRII